MKSKRFLALLCSTTILVSSTSAYAASQPIAHNSTKVSQSVNTFSSGRLSSVTNKTTSTAGNLSIVGSKSLLGGNLAAYLSNDSSSSGQSVLSFKDAFKVNAASEKLLNNLTVGELVLNHPCKDHTTTKGHKMYLPTDHVAIYMEDVTENSSLSKYTMSEIISMYKSVAPYTQGKFYEVSISSLPALAYTDEVKGSDYIQIMVKSPSGKLYSVIVFAENQSYYSDMISVLNKLSFNNATGTTDMSSLTATPTTAKQVTVQQPQTQQSQAQTSTIKPTYTIVTNDYGTRYFKFGNLKFKASPEFKIVDNSNSSAALTLSSPNGLFTVEYAQINLNGTSPEEFAKKLQSDAQKMLKSSDSGYEVKLTIKPFGVNNITDYRLEFLKKGKSRMDAEQHIFVDNGIAHIFIWKGDSDLEHSLNFYAEFLSSIIDIDFK